MKDEISTEGKASTRLQMLLNIHSGSDIRLSFLSLFLPLSYISKEKVVLNW